MSTPELAISEDEAHNLTEAIQNVAQYYDMTADPKAVAWFELIVCLGGIYGTRFVAIRRNKKSKTISTPFVVPKSQAPQSTQAKPASQPIAKTGTANAATIFPSDIFGSLEPEKGDTE